LRPNQTDQDSLPDYETLDAVLRLIVEEQMSAAAVTARGFPRASVEEVARMLGGRDLTSVTLKHAREMLNRPPPGN
jgi:NH3-dependent NAD+ synthetase